MPRLSPSAILQIRDALLGPYPNRPRMVDLFARANHWFDEHEVAANEFRDNVTVALRAADSEGWLPGLLHAAINQVPNDNTLAQLLATYAPSNYAAGIDHFTLYKLSGGYVMIDRDPLRRSMRRLHDPAGQRILHVTGQDCSGKSYTRRLIFHLNQMLGTFTLIDIDLEEQLRMLGPDRVFYPDDIARLVVERLRYENFIVAPPPEDQQWARWNREFCDAFEKRAKDDPEQYWVVLDAFNKVALGEHVLDLIKQLAVRVSRGLFRFRLVLVGYGSEFPLDVLPTVMKDSPVPIDDTQLMEFLLRYLKEERSDLSDEQRTDRAANAVADLLEGLDGERADYMVELAKLLIVKLRELVEEP